MSAPVKKGVYGDIDVLSSVYTTLPSGNGKTIYTCKCLLCGALFEICSSTLARYIRTGGGCAECRKKKRLQARYGDLIGLKANEVEVIGIASRRTARKQKMLCRCLRCGREFEAPAYDLRQGRIKTCFECSKEAALPIGRKLHQDLAVTGTTPIALSPDRKLNRNSSSGMTGVSLIKTGRLKGRYRAYIYFRRKQYHLGLYDTAEQAAEARKAAEKELFGGFLDWYAATYPDKWEAYQKTQKRPEK